jgi:hypothetical protein
MANGPLSRRDAIIGSISAATASKNISLNSTDIRDTPNLLYFSNIEYGSHENAISAAEQVTPLGHIFYVDRDNNSLSIRKRLRDGSREITQIINPLHLSSPAGADFIGTEFGRLADYLPELRNNRISLKRFEVPGRPIGQGNAEHDDAAFKAAFDALMHERRINSDYGVDIYTTFNVFIPPGNYKTFGEFGSDLELISLSCEYNTVTVTNLGNGYFFQCPKRLDTILIDGPLFIGGDGVLHHSYRGNNVSWIHTVKNTIALGYNRAAWAFDAADMPYLRFENNIMRSAPNSQSITKGLAKNGLIDNDSYRNNAFECNNIHLQLGALHSANTEIVNNSFLSFEEGQTEYDIWLIPNDKEGMFGTNSGGIRISGNKFGNEGRTLKQSADRPRIIIAAAQGNSALDSRPDLTWKPGDKGDNFLSGLSFHSNWIYNSSPPPLNDGSLSPFIANYINHLGSVYWGPDNSIAGGRFSYLIEHFDEGLRKTGYTNTNSIFDLGGSLMHLEFGSPFRLGVSNKSMGLVKDTFGMDGGAMAMLPGPDPNQFLLTPESIADTWSFEPGIEANYLKQGNARNNNAVRCIWRDKASKIYINSIHTFSGFEEQMGWVIIQYWANANPIDSIKVCLFNTKSFEIALKFYLPVTNNHRTFCAPFFFPRTTSPESWQLSISAPEIISGQKDECIFGITRISAGRYPPQI